MGINWIQYIHHRYYMYMPYIIEAPITEEQLDMSTLKLYLVKKCCRDSFRTKCYWYHTNTYAQQ